MSSAFSLRAAALLAVAVLTLACHEPETCTPGEEQDCTCEEESAGTRYCLSNRRFDQCYCGAGDLDFPEVPRDAGARKDSGAAADRTDAGRLDAGRDAASDAAAEAGMDAALSDGVLVTAGSGALLKVFTRGDEAWLVVPSYVARLSLLDGGELARWDASRPLSGAAFDGERLVTVDTAKFTLLQPSTLGELASGYLIEPCSSTALSVGTPLLCAAGTQLYALEPSDGGQLGSLHTQRVSDVLAVPGTRRFLSVDPQGYAPPQVLELPVDGGLSFVGDASSSSGASSGGFSAPLAFDGVPPQNLITRAGTLYRISATCGDSDAGVSDPCSARTGTLGLLNSMDAFLGLSTAGERLYALVDPNPSTQYSEARCDRTPCRLQSIDVAARLSRASMQVRVPMRGLLSMHAQPSEKRLVLALQAVAPGRSYSSFEDAGFQVVRLALPEEP